MTRKAKQSEKERKIWDRGLHLVLGSASVFFLRRTREQGLQRFLLEKLMSALIEQNDKVWNTAFIIAFADRTGGYELVSGRVFWLVR